MDEDHLARIRWRWRLAVLAIAAALVILLLPRIADGVAERSFGSATPAGDPEPPAMAWSPAWSTAELGAFVGRGEGLDCSIPPAALLAFSSKAKATSQDLAPVNLRFRQACVAHDLCYRHGRATYGYTQAQCDAALVQAAFRLCRYIPGIRAQHRPGETADERARADALDREGLRRCATEARKVLAGVTLGGAGSYRQATGDADRLGTPATPIGRASTIAEYDPFPQGDFTLPRIGLGTCGGRSGEPVLLTISRRAGGSNVNRYCFDGRTFAPSAGQAAQPGKGDGATHAVAIATRAAQASQGGTAPLENVLARSEYRYEPSMPWLTPGGGLTRRCRNHKGGTTTGDFAQYPDAARYAGCRGRGVQTDPDIVTLLPVPGALSTPIPAIGMETDALRHVDADATLPAAGPTTEDASSVQRRAGCMLPGPGACARALPGPCVRAARGSAYRWSATQPAIASFGAASEPRVAVTLFARGCGSDGDYQTLRSRTAVLGPSGWLPRTNGDAFGKLVEWAVPETAEPVLALGTGVAQRLVSIHAAPVAHVRIKTKLANVALVAGWLAAAAGLLALLGLTRPWLRRAVVIGAAALCLIGLNKTLNRHVGDGFSEDAELAIYPPGNGPPTTRLIEHGRPWLQQRMPVVADGERNVILMPRFRAVGAGEDRRLELDIWAAPFTSASADAGWHALKVKLPAAFSPARASVTFLVPFDAPGGRPHLLVMDEDGRQAVFATDRAPDTGRLLFRPVGFRPKRRESDGTA